MHLKAQLPKEVKVKDLGNLRYFLGIEVAGSEEGIFMCQRKYTLDLLKETGMLGSKTPCSPIEANHHLSGGVWVVVNKERYQRLVSQYMLG